MILSRVRIIPQERYDLEDFIASQSSVRTDSKFWTKQFLSNSNYILKGFKLSGVGLTEAAMDVTEGTLINAASSSDFSWFVVDDATTSITISDGELTDGARNYVEIQLVTETNTPVTKAFWDPAANGGQGAEFNQEIDTMTDLAVQVVVSTGGFSGSSDSLPVGIIDVDGGGSITGIRDKRDLFYKLGTPSDPYNSFTFTSRQESDIDLILSGVAGTFELGEEVSFTSGATATVTQGGTTNIKVSIPSSDSFIPGDTVTGGTSSATGTLDQYQEEFIGADKDIDDFKEALNAVMTLIKEIHGKDFWYQQPNISLNSMWEVLGLSILVGATSSARFSWSGSDLVITDDNGTPLTTDVLAYLRTMSSTADLSFTRETIALADGEVVYVQLPVSGSRTYSGTGAGATNYQVVARGSMTEEGDLYWLAYREGTKLYVRGLGELEAGETRQISDETTSALQSFLGFDPETATSVPYTATPDSLIFSNLFTTASPLVDAISANTANLNFIGGLVTENVYEESIEIVDSITGPNQLLGPVVVDTIIQLPVDSRDGNSTFNYIVGDAVFEVFLNGQFITPLMTDTYIEVGTVGDPSNDIQIKRQLEVGDTLVFRSDTTGGFQQIGGGGGSATLQDAYNNGRTITTVTGQPIEISGPAAEKLLRIFGDIEVTGVIDPAGMTFSREGSDPLGNFDGIYVDSNGDLMYKKKDTGSGSAEVNLFESASGTGAAAKLEDVYDNNSGAPFSKATPIRIDSSGELQMIDPSNEDEVDAIVGVTAELIADSSSGAVTFKGRLKNVSTAITVGSPVYLSKLGMLTDTKPSEGVDGFVSGDFAVRLGTIIKNADNPSNKDLLVDIKVLAQL